MKKTENRELERLTPEQYAVSQHHRIILVADNVRSLHNVGAFFRTADSFAIEQVWLCGITATPPDKEIHKTALGAEQTVIWRYFKDTCEAVLALREQGYRTVCIEQVHGAVMLDDFRVSAEVGYGLIVGNEVRGVDQQVVDLCDGAIEIPQFGTKHSLNVSVAAGVVLWEFVKQLRRE